MGEEEEIASFFSGDVGEPIIVVHLVPDRAVPGCGCSCVVDVATGGVVWDQWDGAGEMSERIL